MQRISTYLPNDDMQFFSRQREVQMNGMQNKLASQSRIKDLRDDPSAAAHTTRYMSHLTRLNRYSKNVGTVQSDLRVSEGYLANMQDVLQRVRELAVQGATGTYSKDDQQKMALEVDHYMKELVMIANSKSPNGTSLFAGDAVFSDAFRTIEGYNADRGENVVSKVVYTGGAEGKQIEIMDNTTIETSFAGNRILWSEDQQIVSEIDASAYVAVKDASFNIDGKSVMIRSGDNISAVIDKINNSGAPVRAFLDPVTSALSLQTTQPHELMMSDAPGSSTLKDLGILSGTEDLPPNNLARSAKVSGGNLFDMMINMRDSLLAGDIHKIGGSALKGIDQAMNNVTTTLAEIGAKDARLQSTFNLIEKEVPLVTQKQSNEIDIDVAQAIMELKMLEQTHKVALETASRVLQPTLLDFLR